MHSLITIMTTIAVYKDVEPTAFDFGGIKKENSIYFLKPSCKPFIQTPVVIAKEDLVMHDTLAPKHQVVVSVPHRFAAWVKRIEESVVDYAIINKKDLFKRELSSEFIAASFKSSVVAPTSWCVNVHPDVSVFDHKKALCEQSDVKKDTHMSCIITLHSVRFTRRNFYCKWLLRSARIQCPPEYCFLDREDDTLSDDDESIGTLRPDDDEAPVDAPVARDEVNHDDEAGASVEEEDEEATCVEEIKASSDDEAEAAGDVAAVEADQEVVDALVAAATESAETADTAIPLGDEEEHAKDADATPSPIDLDAPKGDIIPAPVDADNKEEVGQVIEIEESDAEGTADEHTHKEDADAASEEDGDVIDDEDAEVPTEILAVSQFVDDDEVEDASEAASETASPAAEDVAETVTETPVGEAEVETASASEEEDTVESKEASEEAPEDADDSPVSVVIVVKDGSRTAA